MASKTNSEIPYLALKPEVEQAIRADRLTG